MKKFILKKEDDKISVKDFDSEHRYLDSEIVATFVPDSNTSNKIYFLVGNKPHNFYFANIYGQSLGTDEYETAQEAIEKRMQGHDCGCNKTKVYSFKDIEEAMRELGR